MTREEFQQRWPMVRVVEESENYGRERSFVVAIDDPEYGDGMPLLRHGVAVRTHRVVAPAVTARIYVGIAATEDSSTFKSYLQDPVIVVRRDDDGDWYFERVATPAVEEDLSDAELEEELSRARRAMSVWLDYTMRAGRVLLGTGR